MQEILNWMSAHWVLIAIIVAALVQVLQLATVHWSGRTGLVKGLLFVVNLLSPFTSKDEPGWLKGLAKPKNLIKGDEVLK